MRAARRPRARGAHARRQPAAARRRGVARRCGARRRADARHPGAAGAGRSAQTTLARVLGVTDGHGRRWTRRGCSTRGARRRRPRASAAAASAGRSPRQAAVDLARAQEDVLAQDRSAARSSCSRASSRAAAARTRTGRSTAAPTAWASSAPTGRPACRSSSRTCSTSRACARAGPRPRHRRAPRRARYDEALLTRHEPAAGGGRHGRCRPRRCRRTRRCSSRPRSRARRRRAPATRPGLASIVEVAEAQSLLAQARVSGRGRARRRVAGAAGRGGRAGRPRAVRRRSLRAVGSAASHVVDPRGPSAPHHGPRRGHRRRADGRRSPSAGCGPTSFPISICR